MDTTKASALSDHQSIVVGIDSSSGTDRVLTWSIHEARTRRLPLRLISAYRWPILSPWSVRLTGIEDPERAALRRAADHLIENAVEKARRLAPDVVIDAAVVDGDPVTVLLAEADSAALLVLGSRRLAAIGSFLLGSVATAVAARASCPVVVLRGPDGNPDEAPGVVVGVDGSESSQAVLHFAFDFASRHKLTLHPILCWPEDLLAATKWRPPQPAPEQAERWLAETTAGWTEQYPDVAVHASVYRDHPISGLVTASQTQSLLVVGAHGHQSLLDSLLGSVSQGVLHHAHCPVAVVPKPRN
jgi:nucleotide-binding universal stress UspA family protein